MRKADFQARVRKIEIVNRVLKDQFAQSLQITLGDVALTDENLCELRQFRPNEVVNVVLTPTQVSLFDHLESMTWRGEGAKGQRQAGRSAAEGDGGGVEDLLVDEGDGEEAAPEGCVVAEWKFSERA
ncbi:MAG: hypothetical protein ACPLTR_08055 [Thermacetogeniaceae bacterium]